MLGKRILKIAPPSIQKFDLEDTGKLVAIIAASEMVREYLIKQKILPEHIGLFQKNIHPLPMDDTELGTQKFQDFQEGQKQFMQDSKPC